MIHSEFSNSLTIMQIETLNTNELLDFIDGKLSPQRNLAIQAYILEHPAYVSIINGLLHRKAEFSDTESFKEQLEIEAEAAYQNCIKRLKL